MIRDVSKKVYTDHYLSVGATSEVLEEPSNNAGLRAARAVFSKDTEYVSDGSVNVALEARLSNVLAPFGVKHVAEIKPDYKSLLKTTTGVVFKINCRSSRALTLKSCRQLERPFMLHTLYRRSHMGRCLLVGGIKNRQNGKLEELPVKVR